MVGRAQGYLVSLIGTEGGAKKLETKPAVIEFSDVFPEELSGLTPEWEIEFEIEVLPETTPISKATYWMSPAELKELKEQLQDLLERDYIRPNVSP